MKESLSAPKNVEVKSFTGQKLLQYIPDLARLRVEIFKEYPFLYEGKVDYEEK